MGIPRSSTSCTSNPCFSKKPFLVPTQSGLYPRVLLDAPRKIFGFSCATAEGSARAKARSANAIRKWMTMRPPRPPASFLLQNRVASNLFNRGAPPSRRGLVIVAEKPATDLGGLWVLGRYRIHPRFRVNIEVERSIGVWAGDC